MSYVLTAVVALLLGGVVGYRIAMLRDENIRESGWDIGYHDGRAAVLADALRFLPKFPSSWGLRAFIRSIGGTVPPRKRKAGV